MSVPTVKQIHIPALILHYVFVFVIILTFTYLDFPQPLILGAVFYLFLIIVLRQIFTRSHMKGVRCFKKEKYVEAIPYFEKSYEYFTRNAWVDNFRYITMLSVSRMSYREMALNNIAFCYAQSGDGTQARTYYERLLFEYPGNGLGKAALRMMDAGKQPNN